MNRFSLLLQIVGVTFLLVTLQLIPLSRPAKVRAVTSVILTRAPYFQMLSPNSVTIVWKTDVASDSQVKFSPDMSLDQRAANLEPDTFHVVKLDGLRSNTLCRYRILSDGLQLTGDGIFRTAPASGG